MSWALLGNNQASVPSTGTATTSAVDTTGAQLIVAVCLAFAADITTGKMSDSLGNTWSAVAGQHLGNGSVRIFFAIASLVTGPSHTFSLASETGGSYPTIFVSRWKGLRPGVNNHDGVSGGTAAGTTVQPGTVTPTLDNDLIITGLGDGSITNNKTIDSGFTRQDQQNTSGIGATGAWAYKIQGALAAVNPTWTTGSSNKAASIVAFNGRDADLVLRLDKQPTYRPAPFKPGLAR